MKCSKCQAFGHPSYACLREEKRVWKPKKIGNQVDEVSEKEEGKSESKLETMWLPPFRAPFSIILGCPGSCLDCC